MDQDLPQQVQACQSQSSFSGIETIEWPFLRAARNGVDPEVSTAAASDNESTLPSSTGPPCSNGAIKKSNYFEREASETNINIEKDKEESDGGEGYFFARTSLRTSRKWKVKKKFNKIFGHSVQPASVPTKILEALM